MEAERATLGSIIISPSAIDTVNLVADDFFIERHRWVWMAIRRLVNTGVTPDFVSICDELDKSKRLKEVGGPAYLTKLINESPTSLNLSAYVTIVQEKAKRRKMISLAHNMVASAMNEEADVDEFNSQAVDDLTSNLRTKHDIVPFSDTLTDTLDYVQERAKTPNDTWGIPTGLTDLDRMTGGLLGVWYLAGEPGVGKSIFMLCCLINAAKEGHPGALFSLEMRALAQGLRALSAEAKVPTRDLRSGFIRDEDWATIMQAAEELAKLPIYICDEPELNTVLFRSHLTKAKAQFGVELFALDYLYLMTDADKVDMVPRTELLSQRVMGISRQLGVSGITVNSVTKEGMGVKSAKSTALRGSGQLVHDADTVMFLTKHPADPNLRRLEITKGRDIAELGKIDLVKMGEWPAFHDVAYKKEEPIP